MSSEDDLRSIDKFRVELPLDNGPPLIKDRNGGIQRSLIELKDLIPSHSP